MIEKLITTDATEFNKETLAKLKPYFDLNHLVCSCADRQLWFQNLLTLAQHSLGLAHCIQHNHTARLIMLSRFSNSEFPEFYDTTYENLIGCYSNVKAADQVKLVDHTISGAKHWISMAHLADYGIFRIPVNNTETYVLIDLNTAKPEISSDFAQPFGMEIAQAGSVVFDNYIVPDWGILGHYDFYDNSSEFAHISNIADYGFITNYLGLITALYKELTSYLEQRKITHDTELKQLGLNISVLVMLWQDNLSTLEKSLSNDKEWHRRNTHYTMSKKILIDLIALVLKSCDSRWVNSSNQRFKDALTFSSHMRSLYNNLGTKHFVKF